MSPPFPLFHSFLASFLHQHQTPPPNHATPTLHRRHQHHHHSIFSISLLPSPTCSSPFHHRHQRFNEREHEHQQSYFSYGFQLLKLREIFSGDIRSSDVKSLCTNILKSSKNGSLLLSNDEIMKWIEFALWSLQLAACIGALGGLNDELVLKSVLLGNGLKVSKADVILYSVIQHFGTIDNNMNNQSFSAECLYFPAPSSTYSQQNVDQIRDMWVFVATNQRQQSLEKAGGC